VEAILFLSAILAHVKDPQHEHVGAIQLVTEFVVADYDATNLTRIELVQADTEPRMVRYALRSGEQLPERTRGRRRIHRMQKIMHPRQVGIGVARPA